jgi:rod shape-determining protein MreC
MGRLTIPVKALTQRFAFLLLLSAAVGLIVLGQTESRWVERLRTAVVDVAAPALDAGSRPLGAFSEFVRGLRHVSALRMENEILREENARLLHWQAVARRLETESRALQSLMRYTPKPAATFITARVVAVTGGAFMRSVVLNAGMRDGVGKGSPVVNGDGLVGRVLEAGGRSARILLLTDMNSRIPVVVGASSVRAILTGDNSDLLRLKFMSIDGTTAPGDLVVTSGHGEMFPPGLPVGTVVPSNDIMRVRPYVDWGRLDYVRVVGSGPTASGGVLTGDKQSSDQAP